MNGSIVGTSGVELFSNNIHLEGVKNKLRRKENDTQAVEFLPASGIKNKHTPEPEKNEKRPAFDLLSCLRGYILQNKFTITTYLQHDLF